jgi:hypothetical protein
MVKKFVRKIGVLSLGKIVGIVYAVIGLIFGAIITAASLLIGSAMAAWGFEGDMFGTGAIIVLPIFYGVMGFIMGIVVALVYNLVAKSIGGLELDVE